MVDVSVIIPARNVADLIPAQLNALAQQRTEHTWEVIVADNGSTDDTASVARRAAREFPVPLRLVDASRGAGINVARNEGVKAAQGDVLLFCDADDIVGSDWISSMVVALKESELVGGALDFERLNELGSLPWLLRPSGELQRYRGLSFPVGANFGLRRDAHNTIGPFDEKFLLGYDEAEYFTRAQDLGYQAVFAPEAVVHYRLRGTRKALVRQRFRYGRGSALLVTSHPRLFIKNEDALSPRLRGICRTSARIIKRSFGPAGERDALMVQLATDVGAAVEYARGRFEQRLPGVARRPTP